MLNIDYSQVPESWGSWAPPDMIAERTEIDPDLMAVPQGGTVLDIGAGIAMPLCAYIYAKRPDLRIIPLDPGYGLPESDGEIEDARAETVECFDEETRARLQATDVWYKEAIAAYDEEVPLDDSSVDLVVSHAATPNYSHDLDQTARECLRILKVGGVALHGPMHGYHLHPWVRALKDASSGNKLADFHVRERSLQVGPNVLVGLFTYLRK